MKMKKTVIFTLSLLMGVASLAQKGSVSKAQVYKDKQDYANAKAEIDMAITIEKNAAKTRTWYVRAQIYKDIALSDSLPISSIDNDAAKKSVEAYEKVLSMEKENSSYYGMTLLDKTGMWGGFMDKGSEAYNEKDYSMSLKHFENALMVKPEDSITLYYCGVVAELNGDRELGKSYFYKMVELEKASEQVFSNLIYYERMDKNDETAYEVVKKARALYPDNKVFNTEELSLLMILNRLEEAKEGLIKAIAEDPTVINNHLNLALLYDNFGAKMFEEGKKEESEENYDLAKKSYSEALKLDGDNYLANYNLGAIYVNGAKVYLDEVNAMDLKTYTKNGEALELKAKELLQEAQPYFEKVVELKPEDYDGLITLQSIYNSLRLSDKAEALIDRIEAAEAKLEEEEGEE